LAKTKLGAITRCKLIKGGRAGCWSTTGSGRNKRTIFRFVSRDKLRGLGDMGISIVGPGAAEFLPGFAGRRKPGGSRTKRRRTFSGPFTLDGAGCRDKSGKFVPVAQCTGRNRKAGLRR